VRIRTSVVYRPLSVFGEAAAANFCGLEKPPFKKAGEELGAQDDQPVK